MPRLWVGILVDVTGFAEGEEVVWATDLNQGGAALLIAVLTANGQLLLYPTRIPPSVHT